MRILINTLTDDTCDKEDATPLYTYAETDREAITAWQFSDLTLCDADDVEESTVYRVRGVDYEDVDEASEVLRAEFWEMIRETGTPAEVETLRNDYPARAEAFNNWTDSLCKDGDICNDTYESVSVED